MKETLKKTSPADIIAAALAESDLQKIQNYLSIEFGIGAKTQTGTLVHETTFRYYEGDVEKVDQDALQEFLDECEELGATRLVIYVRMVQDLDGYWDRLVRPGYLP